MGSSCSSPIRRLGKGKRRSSQSSAQFLSDVDPSFAKSQNTSKPTSCENETTQSEEQPSSGSCDADSRLIEKCKNNEKSTTNDANKPVEITLNPDIHLAGKTNHSTLLIRSKPPIDRHLLVSPALSPAPSSCYSPSPASLSSSANLNCLIDINDNLRTIAFGDIIEPGFSRVNSNQQLLIQSDQDLSQCLTIILLTDDGFELTQNNETNNFIKTLMSKVETSLKPFCDEYLYNLRFLNLSYISLVDNFQINNLADTTFKILNDELKTNNNRVMTIVLSNQLQDDSDLKKLLPTRISSSDKDKLSDCLVDEEFHLLFSKWFKLIDSDWYLQTIHSVYPDILNHDSKCQFWKTWLSDSNKLIKSMRQSKRASELLVSLYKRLIEFHFNDHTLLRHTLLIRSSSKKIVTSGDNLTSSEIYDQSEELSQLLSDPNQFSLKRPISIDDATESIGNWVSDLICKFAVGVSEHHLSLGKQRPSYIDVNLFIELSKQRQILEKYLINTTETFRNICFKFYKDNIESIIKSVVSTNNTLQNSAADESSSSYLVFIEGPKGCGKSTLIAQIIKYVTKEIFDDSHLIYRFADTSLDSLSFNRILRSICEQFCQSQGENTIAASYIYSNRKDVMNALNKVLKNQTHVIFIDNLEPLDLYNDSNLDWFGEFDSKQRVKLFVTVESGSLFSDKMLKLYPTAPRIQMPSLTTDEWIEHFGCAVQSNNLKHQSSLKDDLKTCLKSNYHLTYAVADDLINLNRIVQSNDNSSSISPKSVEQAVSVDGLQFYATELLLSLQYIMKRKTLATLFTMLTSARNGLSEQDILNLLDIATKKSEDVSNAWYYIKTLLKPWLNTVVHFKVIKYRLKFDRMANVIDVCLEKDFPNIKKDTRELMYGYFSRKNPAGTTKLETIPLDKGSHFTGSEVSWAASRISEMVHLSILSNPTQAKEQILNKANFFNQFLYGSMPEEFIEDYEKIKALVVNKSSNFEDLSCLIPWIYSSVYPLRYDGSQIYSQIYCRSFSALANSKYAKNKKLNEILDLAACPPRRSLMPISEESINSFIKSRVGQSTPSSTGDSTSQRMKQTSNTSPDSVINAKQRIFTIENNHRHVIVLFPSKCTIIVYDIYEEKAVRTLKNIEQPTDLKMIDQKRAVVLCDRELKIYDLDTGEMLRKIKGVMNNKMPFYQIFDGKYVVALSRNRMYVNMINLNTGELETTFKVGEDRFLNRLHVSKRAGICVCGDETQKPFPLLVWDLNERRLVHDLRLIRHDFLTEISDLSDDGHFVVSACIQLDDDNPDETNQVKARTFSSNGNSPNMIVVFDLNSGTLFKKWKPGVDSCSVKISSLDDHPGLVANGLVDGSIIIWDLATGSRRHTLFGHKAPPDLLETRKDRLFSMDSSGKDQSLRVWNIDVGYCLAVFSPDARAASCQISINGNALVCSFAGEKRLSTLVMCKNETVNDVLKRNKRRKSSKSNYIYDLPAPNRRVSGS